LIDHIKSEADVKFMYHTDGTVTPVVEDIIEMGVDMLNPIQTSALGMDTAVLKELYHGRLCFHGAIDVQQMLPFLTAGRSALRCGQTHLRLGRGGGYILAPCHNIGSDVPPANIEAMYESRRNTAVTRSNSTTFSKPEDRQKPTAEQIAAQAAPPKRERRPRPAK
jgi:uroporphyrinogen decarboxylase